MRTELFKILKKNITAADKEVIASRLNITYRMVDRYFSGAQGRPETADKIIEEANKIIESKLHKANQVSMAVLIREMDAEELEEQLSKDKLTAKLRKIAQTQYRLLTGKDYEKSSI